MYDDKKVNLYNINKNRYAGYPSSFISPKNMYNHDMLNNNKHYNSQIGILGTYEKTNPTVTFNKSQT